LHPSRDDDLINPTQSTNWFKLVPGGTCDGEDDRS
jgi:hypothetical protein